MCLVVNLKTNEFYSRPYFLHNKVYKILEIRNKQLLTPVAEVKVELNSPITASGIGIVPKDGDEISQGIVHVLGTYITALKYKEAIQNIFPLREFVIVECDVEDKNFIAVGYTGLWNHMGDEEFCTNNSIGFKEVLPIRIME